MTREGKRSRGHLLICRKKRSLAVADGSRTFFSLWSFDDEHDFTLFPYELIP